jgi:hypothetical protein
MLFEILIVVAAAIAGAIASVSGFGIGNYPYPGNLSSLAWPMSSKNFVRHVDLRPDRSTIGCRES